MNRVGADEILYGGPAGGCMTREDKIEVCKTFWRLALSDKNFLEKIKEKMDSK